MGISFYACKDTAIDKKSDPKVATKTNETILDAPPLDYPSIPLEIIQKLYDKSDYMDYIFNNLNFSLSQTAKNSIRSSVAFISTDVPSSIPDGCKSIGRKFFHINGEIVLEAELYFSSNCAFYIFYVDNKPTYANVLTKAGINFYNNIINQGKQQEQKIIYGQSSGSH